MIMIASLFGVGFICATTLMIFMPGNEAIIGTLGLMIMTAAGFLYNNFKQENIENKQQVLDKKLTENTILTVNGLAEAKETAKTVAVKAASAVHEAVTTAASQVSASKEAVSELKTAVNGRMEELLSAAKAAAYAEGLKAGKAEYAQIHTLVTQIQNAQK